MLEKVFSSHVLWYNDEGIYIRTFLLSAHDQVKSDCGALTRSINPKAIAPESKNLAAGFLRNRLRKVLRLTDMFDEFHSDLLYELKRGFSAFERFSQGAIYGYTVHLTVSQSPPGPRSYSVFSAPQ